jgi:putative chitinase
MREIQIYEGQPLRARRSTALSAPPRPGPGWLLVALGAAGLVGLIVWIARRRKAMAEKTPMPTLTAAPIVEQPPQVISLDQFRRMFPRLPVAKADLFLPHLNDAMAKAGIVTPQSVAAFLANVALETGGLVYLTEIWPDPNKPTAAQARYESQIPRLGNTQPGDGYRYRGRGALQLTGRAAYRDAGAALGMDLEGNPDLVATDPAAIFGTAAWYWASHKLGPWAESGNFDAVVRGINCGSPTSKCNPYHLDERRKYYQQFLAVLGA